MCRLEAFSIIEEISSRRGVAFGKAPAHALLHSGGIHSERFCTVSIVRVGLAETKNFAEGYDAIFGGKKPAAAKKPAPKAKAAKPKAKKKAAGKKKK